MQRVPLPSHHAAAIHLLRRLLLLHQQNSHPADRSAAHQILNCLPICYEINKRLLLKISLSRFYTLQQFCIAPRLSSDAAKQHVQHICECVLKNNAAIISEAVTVKRLKGPRECLPGGVSTCGGQSA